MKLCKDCGKKLKSKYKHKNCNSCRFKSYKISCKCGKLMDRNSKICVACQNKDVMITDDGHRAYIKRGYVMVRLPNHPRSSNGYVPEHIIKMEDKLGRFLENGENVHHINGIKEDNRIENLELWIKPQPVGIRARDAVKWAKEILEKYKGL